MWNQNQQHNLVFGHRGARALYPENTMLSFTKAIAMGVDGLETDVRLSPDGQLYLFHDDSLDRVTDHRGPVQPLPWSRLRQIKVRSGAEAGEAEAPIPLLNDLLDLVRPTDLLLNVEIKDLRLPVVDQTIRLLEDQGFQDRYCIACFDARITTYAHVRYGVKTQGFPLAYLSYCDEDPESHYYSVGIGMKDLTPHLCAAYRQKGLDPWCWCPNDPAAVRRMMASQASLATCDDPRPALQMLKEAGLHQ